MWSLDSQGETLKQNIALFPYQVYLSITIGMQIVIFYHAVFVSMGV